jgi:hypothetical protein
MRVAMGVAIVEQRHVVFWAKSAARADDDAAKAKAKTWDAVKPPLRNPILGFLKIVFRAILHYGFRMGGCLAACEFDFTRARARRRAVLAWSNGWILRPQAGLGSWHGKRT